ncbi:MAG: [FeFe] hydrogenase H-cluster radical SAM maturase HydE [Eubacterium sp.]|nr:[FeFe] hydrogenase H-cluster radical SAM maturase HydE [Eubacterium sp.]
MNPTEKNVVNIIDKLVVDGDLSDDEFLFLLDFSDSKSDEYLAVKAASVREQIYGKDVYIRGLIEFTNYCKNNCKYCGIRRDNNNATRYRLSEDDIVSCANTGYDLGFRTVVLQGGEDPYYTDDMIVSVIKRIKNNHPDIAVTLSIGEKSKESYEEFWRAGADRYLLRHETANKDHYEFLHPEEMSYNNRIKCLEELKKIGYQVGCGMMIGSPGQETKHLVEDIRFIQKLRPEMVGLGPFIPHKNTEYAGHPHGTVEMTLRMLSIIRLVLPEVLLPATTALGSVDPTGREKGLKAGANVVMPNLSPSGVRDKYLLYDGKICTGEEAAECISCLSNRVSKTGYNIVTSRGDHRDFIK